MSSSMPASSLAAARARSLGTREPRKASSKGERAVTGPRGGANFMAQEINLVDPDRDERHGAPHEALRWLRAHAPVFWHAEGGAGGWPGFRTLHLR